ncbi:MAG: hypothetical protein BKPUNTRY_000479, partial [Candidatus Fervidibacter sp.]
MKWASWMVIGLVTVVGFWGSLTAQIRSPYEAHPHYVW